MKRKKVLRLLVIVTLPITTFAQNAATNNLDSRSVQIAPRDNAYLSELNSRKFIIHVKDLGAVKAGSPVDINMDLIFISTSEIKLSPDSKIAIVKIKDSHTLTVRFKDDCTPGQFSETIKIIDPNKVSETSTSWSRENSYTIRFTGELLH
jgi:hypothetical protein